MVSRTRVYSGFGALLVGGAAWIAACGPGSIDDLTGGRRDGGSLAPDASRDAAPDAEVCLHAAPPDPPPGVEGPGGRDFTFALDKIRLENGDYAGLPKPRGLDLDRTCTCPESDSCVLPSSGKRSCDDAEGRDNLGASLLGRAAALFSTVRPDVIEGRIRSGVYTVIVDVRGWNGTPDDPALLVSITFSSGIENPSGGDAGDTKPKFDGTDVWSVHPAALINGEALLGRSCATSPCVPVNLDQNAYMRGGVIVAKFDRVSVGIESGAFVLEVTSATLTAKLVTSGSGARIEGELAGRWPTERLLASFASLKDPISGKPLCPDNPTYQALKKTVCEAADLATDPKKDRTGAPCDAVSDAISFTGSTAKLGKVERGNTDAPPCSGVVDTCAK